MTTITSLPYTFDIPSPYNNASSYLLKIIDNNGCIISGIQDVVSCNNLDCEINNGTVTVLDCTLEGGTVIIYP
jgi:hypothetical protein